MITQDASGDEREEAASVASMLLHPFVKCMSLLNFGHPIHPTQPIRLENSEFVDVNEYKIRVLHLQPEETRNTLLSPPSSCYNDLPKIRNSIEKRQSLRNSLTEEYWFTRWNKPLRVSEGNRCSCSFRRSARFSKLPEENLGNVSSFDSAPTKIKDLESFVERLIQETLMEALQEYYMSKTTKTGRAYDNLAFVEEVETVVKRRKKIPKRNADTNVDCRHNKPKIKKPFVFLLHGIGCTADVWWNVINSLLNKGFEVAAPDMLGHGYSSAPSKRKAYKFQTLLEVALAIFDYYAMKDESRKFVVIGHSFGLATAIARYRSQQVVQLVLISGGGPTALSPPEIGNEISVFSNLQLLISPLLFCGMKRSLFYSPRGKHFQACDITDESIPKYVLDYIDRQQNWPEGDAAFHRRILIPTLLVHGLKDTHVTLVQECEMERTIPRAFLELIPTAGHMSLLETPEQLSHMILCFVDWWAR